MPKNYTVAIIKPHILKEKKSGKIISMIEEAGFEINDMCIDFFDKFSAESFYEMHVEKPFFSDLCRIMSEGDFISMLIRKPGSENVIKEFRDLIGATNPKEASPTTIRANFGKSLDYNAIHGSDSPESAEREAIILCLQGDDDFSSSDCEDCDPEACCNC